MSPKRKCLFSARPQPLIFRRLRPGPKCTTAAGIQVFLRIISVIFFWGSSRECCSFQFRTCASTACDRLHRSAVAPANLYNLTANRTHTHARAPSPFALYAMGYVTDISTRDELPAVQTRFMAFGFTLGIRCCRCATTFVIAGGPGENQENGFTGTFIPWCFSIAIAVILLPRVHLSHGRVHSSEKETEELRMGCLLLSASSPTACRTSI